MNIPQNPTYGAGGTEPNFRPPTTSGIYANLAELRRAGGPFAPQQIETQGTPEYYQNLQNTLLQIYGQERNVPTGEQFYPIEGSPRTPSPIPSDYSGFVPAGGVPGTSYKWETPIQPEIRSLVSGDIPGQYVADVTNQAALIKSLRGDTSMINQSILNGRPSWLYQVDHIIPLGLGGADTWSNRAVLTIEQHDKKTKAQAIPYTLYSHGDIPLNAARTMAMQWQERDLSNIPQPDDKGLIPIDVARQTADIWSKPKKTTIKDVISAIPSAARDLGKGWLPDPVREFIKGFATGSSLGFVPYEQGEGETDIDKYLGWTGMLAGGIASFVVGGAMLSGALATAGFVGRAGLAAWRGRAAIEAAKAGFGAVKGAGLTQLALPFGKVSAATLATRAGTAAVKPVIFKTLNTAPSYLTKMLTPQNLKGAAKISALFAAIGEGHRFVSSRFNPDIISGRQEPTEIDNHMARLFGDLAIGAVAGIAPPTLKGAAMAIMLPATITYINDPENPVDAITTGVVFGAFHLMGAKAKKAGIKRVMDQFEETANKAAYESLSYYVPDILPVPTPGKGLPIFVKDYNTVMTAKMAATQKVWGRYFLEQGRGMSLNTALTEIKRITVAARQLYKSGLTKELRAKADIDDLLSFGKMAKNPGTSNLQNRFNQMDQIGQPESIRQAAELLDDVYMTKSVPSNVSSGKYLTGDAALTGAGLDINTPEARLFFAEKARGNASPNILIGDRKDLEPLFHIKNRLIPKSDIEGKLHDIDPHPDNALQAFGIIKDSATGQKSLIELGWIASDFRLNIGKYAFNRHPAVLKGEYTPIKINKDQLAPKMRQEGVSVLVAELDPRATVETISTQKIFGRGEGKPFVPVRFGDQNWEISKSLSSRIKLPKTSAVSETNKALAAQNISRAIAGKPVISEEMPSGQLSLFNQPRIQEPAPVSQDVLMRQPILKELPAVSKEGAPSIKPAPISDLSEKIVTAAAREPLIKKTVSKLEPVTESTFKNQLAAAPVKTTGTVPQSIISEPAPYGLSLTPEARLSPRGLNIAKDFINIGAEAIDDAVLTGSAAFNPAKYSQLFDTKINNTLKMVDAQLARGKLPTKEIWEIKNHVKGELQRKAEFRLMELSRTPQEAIGPELTKTEIEDFEPFRPVGPVAVTPEEAFKNIERGLKANKTEPKYFFAKAWDWALRYLFGENYKSAEGAKLLLSTTPPEGKYTPQIGKELWNRSMFRDINIAGREITQPQAIQKLRATRYKYTPEEFDKLMGEVIANRKNLLAKTPAYEFETGKPLKGTAAETAQEMISTGMNVRPWFQEEGMIKNLTNLEGLMAGISSDIPLTPRIALEDFKSLALGNKKKNIPGILTAVNRYLKSERGYGTSLPFSKENPQYPYNAKQKKFYEEWQKMEKEAEQFETLITETPATGISKALAENQKLYKEGVIEDLQKTLDFVNLSSAVKGVEETGAIVKRLVNIIKTIQKTPAGDVESVLKSLRRGISDPTLNKLFPGGLKPIEGIGLREGYQEMTDGGGGPGWDLFKKTIKGLPKAYAGLVSSFVSPIISPIINTIKTGYIQTLPPTPRPAGFSSIETAVPQRRYAPLPETIVNTAQTKQGFVPPAEIRNPQPNRKIAKIQENIHKFVTGETPEIYYGKKRTDLIYPLEDKFVEDFSKFKMSSDLTSGTTAGSYFPPRDKVLGESIYNKLPERVYNILPKVIVPTGEKIKIQDTTPSVMLHEFLHKKYNSMFSPGSEKEIKYFQDIEKLKIERPEEWNVLNKTFYDRYGKQIIPTEVYAWYGATFGMNGLKSMAPSMRKWYVDVFKFKGGTGPYINQIPEVKKQEELLEQNRFIRYR